MFHMNLKNCSSIITSMERKMENLIWVLVGLVAIVAVVSIIMAVLFGNGYSSGNYGTFGMMGVGYYGMGLVMPIIGVIALVFVLLFIYYLVESAAQPLGGNPANVNVTPEEVVKLRFARGEITQDEYSRLIENLRK